MHLNVEVTALLSCEEKEEQFTDQVAQLRQRFYHSIAPGDLAGDRRGVVPASGFCLSAQQIWRIIKENKDLDLPAHQIMVATVLCEEIAEQKLSRLASDENWLELQAAIQSGPVSGFGKKLSAILDAYISEYETESIYFDEGVKHAKHQLLESKALDLVHPAFFMMLGHLRHKALESFKNELEPSLGRGKGFAASVHNSTETCTHEFDQECKDAAIKQANWDTSKVKEKLQRDIEAHASSVCSKKLSQIVTRYEEKLVQALNGPVELLLEASEDTWPSIRKLLKCEIETAALGFSEAIAGFELDPKKYDEMMQSLRPFARNVVEKKAREEAGKVMIRMKDRFSTVLNHDSDSLPRVWTGKEDIRKISKDARSVSLKLLSAMVAIRLDEKPDNIEHILFSSLMDENTIATSRGKSIEASTDPLASSTWPEVSPKDTLITPVQCKSLWKQFKAETVYVITQAISAQEAYKRDNNWFPPAILAMIVLGFNKFMLLLRNPLYLLVLFVVYLLSMALWLQMDIAGEFQHGTLAGMLSISTKFFPALMNLLRRLVEEAQGRPTPEGLHPIASQSFRNETRQPSSLCDPSVSSNVSDDTVEFSSPNLTQTSN